MALPLVVAGIAARAAAKKVAKKVATKAAKKSAEIKKLNPSGKTVKKIIQKSKTNQVAKNSVKVKPANKTNPSNAKLNLSENARLKRIKSGDLAKGQARLEEKRNQISNQFFGKDKPIKINSSIKSKKAVKKPSTKKK
jgi:hypothetical protein